jgi:hypothetical protein
LAAAGFDRDAGDPTGVLGAEERDHARDSAATGSGIASDMKASSRHLLQPNPPLPVACLESAPSAT